jgi:hypothetical protein
MQPCSLNGQAAKWPKHTADHNGTSTFAHDIQFINYVDAYPLRLFDSRHPQAPLASTYQLLRSADPYLVERAERDGFAAPDCRVQFGPSCVGMTNWQGPEHAAQVNLYDVAATPRVNQPVIFEAHYGPLMLDIHINPSCGAVCPPSVMSNEAVVLLQRPAPGESVKIGVKYMPTTGNILINELTDPQGIVLDARSGRRYAPEATGDEEFLSNPAAVDR